MADLQGVFQKAKDDFMRNLSPSEKAQFHPVQSINELLDELRTLESTQKARRRSLPLFQTIKKFGDNLEPFFKVIEILCASHPEWSNIALGALRLILQLASHFVTFFEKLCECIKKLDAKLPRYREILESLATSSQVGSPRLLASLTAVIELLFEFFTAVARVFSKNGKIKRTPVVVAELMWKPFDSRFQGILQTVDFHTEIIQEEIKYLLLGQIRNNQHCQNQMIEEGNRLQEILKNCFGKYSRDAFLKSTVQWINPPANFKLNLEQAQAARFEGTAEWIFDHPTFMAWRQATAPFDESRRLLWVHGNPGSGKTVLAASVIEELSRHAENDVNRLEVFYHFFNKTSGTYKSRIDAYRSIAYQLFRRFREDTKIQDIFTLAMSDYPTQTKATESELLDLIRQVFRLVNNPIVILDGIDECFEERHLFQHVSSWCYDSDVGIMLSSRPNVACLLLQVGERAQIKLSREDLDDDIQTYLQPQITEMNQAGFFPSGSPEDEIVARLVSGSAGMFLWTRLMISYLHSPALSRSERLDAIMVTTPEGLDEMYHRIHAQILSLDRPSRELACRALTWITYSPQALDCGTLKQAIKPDDHDTACEEFHNVIIISCCGFVERSTRGVYKYIHLSVEEYFLSEETQTKTSLAPLVPNKTPANKLILTRIVSFLAYEMPLQRLTPTNVNKLGLQDIRDTFPLLPLAALEWMPIYLDHTSSGSADQVDTAPSELVSKFLNLRLNVMVWIEALYTLSSSFLPSRSGPILAAVSTIVSENHWPPAVRVCLNDVLELLNDLQSLDKAWHPTLAARPPAIWEDITMFTKSRFLVPTKAGSLESLAPSMECDGITIRPMFSISRSSKDGRYIAILSVYPCQTFSKLYDTRYLKVPFNGKVYRDWIVTFETRVLPLGGNPTSSSTFTASLEATDIRLFLDQRTTRGGGTGLGILAPMRIPLSIKPDLSAFTVLDNLYSLEGEGPYSLARHVFPLTAKCPLTQFWSVPSAASNYTYEISWADDGSYLVFTDFQEDSSSSWIGVVQTASSGLQPSLKLINSTYQLLGYGLKEVKIEHHPSKPILAFGAGRAIYLWMFHLASPEIFHLLPFYPGVSYGSITISFSQCGEFLVIHDKKKGRPETLRVPPDVGGAAGQIKRKRTSELCQPEKKAKPLQSSECSDEATETGLGHLLPSINDSRVIVKSNSSGTTMTTVRKNVEPYSQVEIIQVDGSSNEQVTPILQVPTYIQATNFSVAVHTTVDDGDENFINIILNKTSTEGTGTRDRRSGDLPIVVRKDARSLAVQRGDFPGEIPRLEGKQAGQRE